MFSSVRELVSDENVVALQKNNNKKKKTGKTALSIDAIHRARPPLGFDCVFFDPLAVCLGVSCAAHPLRPSSVFTETRKSKFFSIFF